MITSILGLEWERLSDVRNTFCENGQRVSGEILSFLKSSHYVPSLKIPHATIATHKSLHKTKSKSQHHVSHAALPACDVVYLNFVPPFPDFVWLYSQVHSLERSSAQWASRYDYFTRMFVVLIHFTFLNHVSGFTKQVEISFSNIYLFCITETNFIK